MTLPTDSNQGTTPQSTARGTTTATSATTSTTAGRGTTTPAATTTSTAGRGTTTGGGSAAGRGQGTPVNTKPGRPIGTIKKGRGNYDVRWNGRKWVKVKGSESKYPAATPTPETPVVAPPPELPALSTEEQLMYDYNIGAAGQGVKELETSTAKQQGLLLQRYKDTLDAMSRGGYASGQQLREQLSEGGLGFSPMFLGKGMRDIAQQTGAEQSRLTAEKTAQEEAMLLALEAAKTARIAELERLRIQSLVDRSARAKAGIA